MIRNGPLGGRQRVRAPLQSCGTAYVGRSKGRSPSPAPPCITGGRLSHLSVAQASLGTPLVNTFSGHRPEQRPTVPWEASSSASWPPASDRGRRGRPATWRRRRPLPHRSVPPYPAYPSETRVRRSWTVLRPVTTRNARHVTSDLGVGSPASCRKRVIRNSSGRLTVVQGSGSRSSSGALFGFHWSLFPRPYTDGPRR